MGSLAPCQVCQNERAASVVLHTYSKREICNTKIEHNYRTRLPANAPLWCNVIVISPSCDVALKSVRGQYVVLSKVNINLFSFVEIGYVPCRTRRGDLRLYKQMLGTEAILAQRRVKSLHVGLVQFLLFYICGRIHALKGEFYCAFFNESFDSLGFWESHGLW